jgi:hypothetical protein
MPAVKSITISVATTPARSFTFTPQTRDGGIIYMNDRTESVPALQPVISLEMDSASASRSTDKLNLRINLPKVVTDAIGVKSVSSIGRFTGSGFIFPNDWSALDRETLIRLAAGLLQETTMVQAAGINREGYY